MSAVRPFPHPDQPPVIALLPLDERPACARLPGQVAAVAGAGVRTPPAGLMPSLRTPGDPDGLSDWVADRAGDCDAVVASLETLGHGGLIASRTTRVPVLRVLRRWSSLDACRRAGLTVEAVTLVTRTPDSDDALEEPEYWNPHGPALHRLSAAVHRAEEAPGTDPAELAAAHDALPPRVRDDFLARRLRNHTLNLAALQLVADGQLDGLVVGADDTAPWGLATAELGQLRRWTDRLGLGDRVSVRPGADEAVTALVARALGHLHGHAPVTVRVDAVDQAGLDRIAPYENMPVAATVAGQITACGARQVTGTVADVHLLVHTPDGAGDWAVAPPSGRPDRAAATAAALAARAEALLDAGHAVAVADCAQPNGSDPLLVAALVRTGVAERLSAYAGWNTAGNTLGTAVAHAVTAVLGHRAGTFDAEAHRRLLAHRFLEDWGYMTRVRAAARAELGSVLGAHDHVPAAHPVHGLVERGLAECARELSGLGMEIVPGSVRLPWRRTFEADFDLRPATATAAHDTTSTSLPETEEPR